MPRTNVPPQEARLVYLMSGGICAFPNCGRNLIEPGNETDDPAFIGEIAHIVADSRQGPRGDSPMTDAERDRHPNLLLLCQHCHAKIDKQPLTYSVPVLRQIKVEHEAKVGTLLAPPVVLEVPEFKRETIHSSLLPVTHLPLTVFVAPCGYGDRQDDEIKKRIKYPKDTSQIIRFLVREKKLYSFHDLRDPDGPFSEIVDPEQVEKLQAQRFCASAEGHRRYVTLLNRAMFKYTSGLSLRYDPIHRRFYFPVLKQGEERSVKYRPLNRETESRQVAWEPKTKSTGEGKGFWWHLAADLRFHRMADDQWCFSIRPERHLTTDGQTPLAPEKIGRKVTRLKAGMFNDKYLSEVNFWRDYLSRGMPRFSLEFGSQSAVISTAFVAFDLSSPGIPGDDMAFRNQTYEEDLFTLTDYQGLKQGEDLDWDDEDIEDEAEDSDSN